MRLFRFFSFFILTLIGCDSLLEKHIFNGEIEKARELRPQCTSEEDFIYLYFLEVLQEYQNGKSFSEIYKKNENRGELPFIQTHEVEENDEENNDENEEQKTTDENNEEKTTEEPTKKDVLNGNDKLLYLFAAQNSPFFPHIYARLCFFSFEEMHDSTINIYNIYKKIAKRVTVQYIRNRFFFHDKIEYGNITYVPETEYLMNLIKSGDKKAEKTYVNLVVSGFLDLFEQKNNLIYLAEKHLNGKAMTLLGNMYLVDHHSDNSDETNKKDEDKKDTTMAMHYFRSAVAQGDFFAYNGLGRIFLMPEHNEPKMARSYFEEAASHGSAEGEYQLYKHLSTMYKIEDLGLNHLIRAVKKSYMPALFTYAERLTRQGDISPAVAHLLPICDFDWCITALQNESLEDYKNGKYKKSLMKLLFLSMTGSLNSISNAVYILKTQKNIIENQNEILFSLLDKLANMGQVKYLTDLADCYYFGKGVKQNYAKAFSFNYSAFLYKQAKAAYNLASMYLDGKGTGKSIISCVRMLQLTKEYESNTYLLVWYTSAFILIKFFVRDLIFYGIWDLKYYILSIIIGFGVYCYFFRKDEKEKTD